MIQIDWKSRVPIYDQLINGILRLKALGVLKEDEKLPSVRSLAVTLGINPNTVQKAYSQLEANDVIYSVAGKGSFISGGTSAELALRKSLEEAFLDSAKKLQQIGVPKERMLELIQQIDKEAKNDSDYPTNESL